MCDKNPRKMGSWGVIGPGLQFSRGTVYYALTFFFLIGAAFSRAANVIPWATVGFLFQRVIRRRYFGWWAKYNYVLSAALDTGTALGIILIFFCLQYPLNGQIGEHSIQTWWGNTVIFETSDWKGEPLKTVPPGETFG
ncbi:hypothetical protein MPER_07514, partial [Moniliophthora perniciosa FA553]